MVVSPTDCDARGVRALGRALLPRGVCVGVTMECHGEARGQHGRPLFTDRLLIEVRPEEWDAVVFAGGRGAERVAEDPLARDLARHAALAGRIVAAFGEGKRVLDAARVDGLTEDAPVVLAEAIVSRLAP